MSGDRQVVYCRDYSKEEIGKWLELLRTQSGDKTNLRYRKMWHTENPSIQGPWTPFTHKDPVNNLATFPNEKLSQAVKLEPTATEKLIELFQQQQIASLENRRAE